MFIKHIKIPEFYLGVFLNFSLYIITYQVIIHSGRYFANIKTSKYKQDLKKKIVNKHLKRELEVLYKIEDLILSVNNLQELISHLFKNVYKIEKKSSNLKEIYMSHVNKKIRLYMKPVGHYPYNLIEIIKIEFVKIDDKHYNEG